MHNLQYLTHVSKLQLALDPKEHLHFLNDSESLSER